MCSIGIHYVFIKYSLISLGSPSYRPEYLDDSGTGALLAAPLLDELHETPGVDEPDMPRGWTACNLLGLQDPVYSYTYIYIYVERDCIYIYIILYYIYMIGDKIGHKLGNYPWWYNFMGIPLGNNMGVHIHTYTILDLKNIYKKKNKWGMTIGQNLWNPRVNSHHISWEFLMLMFLICKTKAQMQGSLSHLAGFLQCLRKILDVDPQKIYGSIGLDTSPHRYGSSQIGPHLQVNMATMSVVCGYQNSLTCAHSVGEHVAAVGKPHHQKKIDELRMWRPPQLGG